MKTNHLKMNNGAPIGVVGLGMMGSSIATALLLNGQKVVALSSINSKIDSEAPNRVKKSLVECMKEGLTEKGLPELLENIHFTSDYTDLRTCWLVMECVIEDLNIKKEVYSKIENNVDDTVIITSNTSAIPISILQNHLCVAERFFGMHWAEPAYTSRFLEIVCGEKSPVEMGEQLHSIAKEWGKEPTLVRKDIRGFITNRIMYAMYREAMHLVESGYATIEDVDRACKNDGGHWMTFCGLFRYMDLTGLKAYHAVMKDLFPELSNQTTVPKLIDDIAKKGGNGISNGVGFYTYSKEEALEWEKAFERFSFDINKISLKYAEKTSKI
tara:strand:- start:1166 stop:2146 length:981 start_codon:yes stop_codon:yes gene_type:complete